MGETARIFNALSRPDQLLHRSPIFRSLAGETLRPGGIALTDRLMAHAALMSGSSVLDLGCGLGVSAKRLHNHWRMQVTALDHCLEDLLAANHGGENPLFVCADMHQPPFRPGMFHAVLCECVLSLSFDQKRLLKTAAFLLKPGGLLLCSDLYLRANRTGCGTHCAEHASCLDKAVTRSDLEQQIRYCGFTVTVFEDHSRALAELAGKMIFAGMDPGLCASFRPGYCLIVAERTKTEKRAEHD